jgi:hypothetical protein
MAVVNSEEEAEVLRFLYFNYGPDNSDQNDGVKPTEPPSTETTPTPEPADATVHIGFHDIFIEGEYLTVRSK